MAGRIVRLAETGRSAVRIYVDGAQVQALCGDTVLTAVLLHTGRLRLSEFAGHEPRAGFCLMGACQDCWIWTEEGNRLQACMTYVADGMRLRTDGPPPIAVFSV